MALADWDSWDLEPEDGQEQKVCVCVCSCSGRVGVEGWGGAVIGRDRCKGARPPIHGPPCMQTCKLSLREPCENHVEQGSCQSPCSSELLRSLFFPPRPCRLGTKCNSDRLLSPPHPSKMNSAELQRGRSWGKKPLTIARQATLHIFTLQSSKRTTRRQFGDQLATEKGCSSIRGRSRFAVVQLSTHFPLSGPLWQTMRSENAKIAHAGLTLSPQLPRTRQHLKERLQGQMVPRAC